MDYDTHLISRITWLPRPPEPETETDMLLPVHPASTLLEKATRGTQGLEGRNSRCCLMDRSRTLPLTLLIPLAAVLHGNLTSS